MTRPVFISRSTDDAAWVGQVRDQIERVGLSTQRATHDVQLGHDIVTKVQKTVGASAAVVVVLTKNAAASMWVQREIG